MTRLRYNGLSTTLGASLASSATAVTFGAALTHSGGTNVPTISGTDYIPLSILDAAGKLSEVVYLTAYISGATTGTITRAQESTTGVSHSSGDKVVHGPTARDIAGLPALTELATNASTSSLTFVAIPGMTATFTPASSAVIVSASGVASHNTAGKLIAFQVSRTGTGTTTVLMGSPQAASVAGSQFGFAVTRKFTDLTPGVAYTFTLNWKVYEGTAQTRPASFPENEELTFRVEDAAPLG